MFGRRSPRSCATITLARDSVQVCARATRESPVAAGATREHRVDEKLTERRDEAPLDGIEGTQEMGADLGAWVSEPVSSGFGGRSDLLDAEEARGSNPLAPTNETASRQLWDALTSES
jgi:hypothetical protein